MTDSDHLPTLRLRPGRRPRAQEGHPWVFAGEVENLLPASCDGGVAVCRDARGKLLGSGIYNGRSQIVWRRYSKRAEDLDAALFHSRLDEAIHHRGNQAVCRLVWSESDRLPGLVVDRYGEVLVIQISTLAMEARRGLLSEHLQDRFSPLAMVWRDDLPVRAKEGLPVGPAHSEPPSWPPFWLSVGGVEFHIDPLGGQKTGLYLDQREQHILVASLARGKRVLDCFCNQGGFALHAARAGAATATGMDSSAEAIAAGRLTAAHNRLGVEFIEANVFDALKPVHPGAYDLIILDPPPFAPGKDRVEGALRGYKEINLRALKILPVGGILATYSCSHHIGYEMFREMLAQAAHDAGRGVRLLHRTGQPADHPVLLHHDESEYLRGYILEVVE
ncbi:MAG: class I SAM-dependent rRNA methyltransferase [Candidatus Methylacidiphilales bacterium]|nr:class I SAM-dependent rRNA methyltransferase [Candidatus Methylacidiphilales bacterium]